MMPEITVVTCTFNAASTLRRTLQSVLNQDLTSLEHIIIDGLSADGTLEIISGYEKENLARGKHKVVKKVERDNGLYDAMNKGLRLASGRYIVFINAGDTFPDNHTLSHVAAAINTGEPLPGVLFGDTDIVDADGRFVRHRRLRAGNNLSWRGFRQGMLVCHQAFYALSSIAKTTFYDTQFRYSADVDWCIRVMKQAEKEGRPIVNVNRVVANYLAEGMTTAHHKASLRERFLVMRRHYGLFATILCHAWFAVRAVFKH